MRFANLFLGSPKTKTRFLPKILFVLLALLVFIDVLFLVFHLTHEYSPLLASRRWDLRFDQGYSEWFQYGKQIFVVLILLWLSVFTSSLGYALFALLFGLVFADDFLGIHESLGDQISTWLGTVDHVGELIYMLVIGVTLLFPVLLFYVFKSTPDFKVFTINLLKLIFLYAFFGGVIDFVSSEIYFPSELVNYIVRTSLDTLEDFGENVVMTGILIFIVRHLIYIRFPKIIENGFMETSLPNRLE